MNHARISRHFRKEATKFYGFEPRITKWKGKIYISDPVRPSEPWDAWEDEKSGLYYYWKKNHNWEGK